MGALIETRRVGLSAAGTGKRSMINLPMLKYGTQLPPPTKVPAIPPTPPPVLLSSQRVSVVDFDIPFGSVLKIMFKWMAAALVVFCCFLPVIFVLWLIVAAIFAAVFSGAMSTFHHP